MERNVGWTVFRLIFQTSLLIFKWCLRGLWIQVSDWRLLFLSCNKISVLRKSIKTINACKGLSVQLHPQESYKELLTYDSYASFPRSFMSIIPFHIQTTPPRAQYMKMHCLYGWIATSLQPLELILSVCHCPVSWNINLEQNWDKIVARISLKKSTLFTPIILIYLLILK